MEKYLESIINFYGPSIVFYGTSLSLALSWMILVLSKMIFNDCFENYFWKYSFIIVIGFSSIIEIFASSGMALGAVGYSNEILTGFAYIFFYFNLLFAPFLTLYFIAYLTCFLIRLRRRKKRKTENDA